MGASFATPGWCKPPASVGTVSVDSIDFCINICFFNFLVSFNI